MQRADHAIRNGHFDRSLTPFNFLRYADPAWRRYDNPIIPQNRLRISDYRRLVRAGGFNITQEVNRRGSAADLSQVPLATHFQKYDREDLLVIYSRLTAQVT